MKRIIEINGTKHIASDDELIELLVSGLIVNGVLIMFIGLIG